MQNQIQRFQPTPPCTLALITVNNSESIAMQQRRPPFIAALISFLLLAVYASAQGALDQLPLVDKHLGHQRSGGIPNTNQNQQGQPEHLSGGIPNTNQNQISANTNQNQNQNQNPIQQRQARQLLGSIPNANQNPIQQGQTEHLSGSITITITNTNQNQNAIQQGQVVQLSGDISNINQNKNPILGHLLGGIQNTNQNENPTQQGQAEQLSGNIPNTNQSPIQGLLGHILGGIAHTNQNQVQAGNSNNAVGTGNVNQNQSCSGNSSAVDSAALIQEFLYAHNVARKMYNEPPFTWDDKLASYAQTYAEKLYNECQMIHSNGCYGENIFWGSNLHCTPSEAVKFWYDEYKYYDFNTHTCVPGMECHHFTQMVWRDSLRLGCAVLHCRPGAGMLIICEYDPPGNIENENPFDNNNLEQN